MTSEQVHELLLSLATEPVPDPDAGWGRLRASLPDRPPGFITRLRSWVRRPLVISVASLTLGTGTAYATGFEPLRNGVDWLWDQIVGSDDDQVEGVQDGGSEEDVGPSSDDSGAGGRDDDERGFLDGETGVEGREDDAPRDGDVEDGNAGDDRHEGTAVTEPEDHDDGETEDGDAEDDSDDGDSDDGDSDDDGEERDDDRDDDRDDETSSGTGADDDSENSDDSESWNDSDDSVDREEDSEDAEEDEGVSSS